MTFLEAYWSMMPREIDDAWMDDPSKRAAEKGQEKLLAVGGRKTLETTPGPVNYGLGGFEGETTPGLVRIVGWMDLQRDSNCCCNCPADTHFDHENRYGHGRNTSKPVYLSNLCRGIQTVAAIVLLILTLIMRIDAAMEGTPQNLYISAIFAEGFKLLLQLSC
ncbi:hypothetical protein NC651_031570 [Populus alba x Populus x berolinensis]|nr:hypothetical protein NC651_031570 [Populus alba x Populus x berolinensis]